MKNLRIRFTSYLLVAGIFYGLVCAMLGNPILADDSWQYYLYAKNLFETGIYGEATGIPDMKREPGYGWFLFFFYSASKTLGLNWTEVPRTAFLTAVVFAQSLLSFFAAHFFFRQWQTHKKVAQIFLTIFLVSPTVVGMNTLIFSESIFVTSLVFAFGFLLKFLDQRKTSSALLSGICFLLAALTKDYLSYFFQFLLAFAIFTFAIGKVWNSHSLRFHGKVFALLFAFPVFGAQIWQWRGDFLLGKEAFPDRKAIALAGKIVRWENINLDRDWKPAIYASLGTNFCIENFGKDRCFPFHMLAADHFGLKTWGTFYNKLGNRKDAWGAMKLELAGRYWSDPKPQFVGSSLEILRILFVESAPPVFSSNRLLSSLPKLWRFGGSILIWLLAIVGAYYCARKWDQLSLNLKLILALFTFHLFYHFLVMSQVTNLARYGFPILPALYLWASFGIFALKERFSEIWK